MKNNKRLYNGGVTRELYHGDAWGVVDDGFPPIETYFKLNKSKDVLDSFLRAFPQYGFVKPLIKVYPYEQKTYTGELGYYKIVIEYKKGDFWIFKDYVGIVDLDLNCNEL
jgi:hypothetical protein